MTAYDTGQMAGSTTTNHGLDADFGSLSRSLARGAVTAFAAVVDEMGRIREMHREICGNLDQFADLIGSRDADDALLDGLDQDVRHLGAALSRFCDLAVSPEARGRARAARVELAAIEKCSHVLTAIASLMGTTIASLGLDNLDKFIAELRQTAQNIKDSADTVTGHLVHLDDRGDQLLQRCNTAATILAEMPLRFASPRERLGQLAQDEARVATELTDRARGLTRDGHTHLKSFVTAMQFSDRLAQRLDHLATMLSQTGGGVERLAAAHARRCVDDIREVSDEVRATMKLLADLGHAGARVFSEGRLASMISETLAARAELTGFVTDELGSVQIVVETAKSEAAATTQMAVATSGSLEGLKDASKNLALASYNSMLVSNRYAQACGPMKVMSKEVRQIASDCLSSVDQTQMMIGQITHGSEEAQTDLAQSTTSLLSRTQAFKDQTKSGAQRLEAINQMRETSSTCAQSLLFMVDAVTESMDRVEGVAARLADLAKTLEASSRTATEPDPDRINRIWASYTMEEERQVHAQVFAGVPGIEVHAESVAQSVDDDIDDLLF